MLHKGTNHTPKTVFSIDFFAFAEDVLFSLLLCFLRSLRLFRGRLTSWCSVSPLWTGFSCLFCVFGRYLRIRFCFVFLVGFGFRGACRRMWRRSPPHEGQCSQPDSKETHNSLHRSTHTNNLNLLKCITFYRKTLSIGVISSCWHVPCLKKRRVL